MTYKKIIESDYYKAEIYDNCTATLEIRSDGLRARTKIDGTKWVGNSGGFNTNIEYYDGRKYVKQLLKIWRNAQRQNLIEGYEKNSFVNLVLTDDYQND